VPHTSAPDPVRDVTPAEGDVLLPANGTLPTSASLQAGVDTAVGVTETLSKVAVAVVPATWLETASPTSTDPGRVKVSLPTSVQVAPSADSPAVMRFPARTSRTQRGAVDIEPAVLTELLPSAVRR
jgi:hypothetical protein